MPMLNRLYLTSALLFFAAPLWSQDDLGGAAPAGVEAPMITPAPISAEGYSLDFASETPRTNYLRGALNVGTAYDDNVLLSNGPGISDIRYSIFPSISMDQSGSRFRWNLTYNPWFTFYQRHSSINEIDHNVSLGAEYRLSPNVTLSLRDTFQKTSDFLNLTEGVPTGSEAIPQQPIGSIVPPTATSRISSFSDVELTYQFSENAMIGAKGKMAGLWYPDRANLPGLFDSTSESGEGFYTVRLSTRNYVGATYEFQTLLTHPSQETQTHSAFGFYTLYLPPRLAVSVFGGPEHSDTFGGTALPHAEWSPAVGGSLAWHAARSSLVLTAVRRVSDGGGLSGAVHSTSADASMRWQLARTLESGVGVGYSASKVLDSLLPFGSGGHTWSGTIYLQHPLGERLAVQLRYTRLHQSYADVPVLANAPNRNNILVSLTYQFDKPLGR
jgi:hypothetical protein